MTVMKVTPLGVFKYFNLTKAFTAVKEKPIGDTNPLGFRMVLSIPATEAKPLMDILKPAIAEAKAEVEKEVEKKFPNLKKPYTEAIMKQVGKDLILPYREELDEEGNDTGNLLFTFKHKVKDEETFPVKIYDAQGKLLSRQQVIDLWIGRGTEGKIGFTMTPYASGIGHGVSLKLQQVQIINLVSKQGGGGSLAESAYGFQPVEGGFTVEQQPDLGQEEGSEEEEGGEFKANF